MEERAALEQEARNWPHFALAACAGAIAGILLLFVLSRLGAGIWLRGLGEGTLADVVRQALSTRTFALTGLMLYGAHFVPVKMIAGGSQTVISVPTWAHLLPVLPLLAGGYLTATFGREAAGGLRWAAGAAVAVPYSVALLLAMGAFTMRFDLLLTSIWVGPSWEGALLLLPLWSAVLGALGGLLVGRE